MFLLSVLSAALVLDCADEIGGLGDSQKAMVPLNAKSRVTQADLEPLVSLPPVIDGDVARLHIAKDLRLFGIADFEQTRIERIEIFGFDRAPVLLATIFLEKRPHNRDAVHLWLDQEYLYVALKRGHPGLLQWMLDRKILNPQSAAKIKEHEFLIEELIDEARVMIQEKNLPIPSWNSIIQRLHGGYELERRKKWRDHFALPRNTPPAHLSAKARQYAVPNPPNRETTSVQFDGWLAWDHSALVVLTYAPYTHFAGVKVALHPKLKTLYHPAFPSIDQRIAIERQFELSWLKRENLLHVELASSADLHVFGEYGGQVLIFESAEDLPEGVALYRLDSLTGTRLTDQPEIKPARQYPD